MINNPVIYGSGSKVIVGTTEVEDGSISTYPEGTLYVVYEDIENGTTEK